MIFIEYLSQFVLAILANVIAGLLLWFILRNKQGGKKPPLKSRKQEYVFLE